MAARPYPARFVFAAGNTAAAARSLPFYRSAADNNDSVPLLRRKKSVRIEVLRVIIRRIIMVSLLTAFATGQAMAEWTDATNTALLEALVQVGGGFDQETTAGATDAIKEAVLDPDTKPADWQKVCRTFFEDHPFTARHGSFWAKLITEAGEAHERAAQRSGEFAAEAVAAAFGEEGLEIDSLRAALHWLDYIATGLSETARRPVADALRAALSKEPPDMERLLRVEPLEQPEETLPGNPPEVVESAIQTCLTLSQYAKQGALNAWLRLPDTMRVFQEGAGVLLFDNGVLDPPQLASLESLFRAVPPELHEVVAIIVPEGMRLDPDRAALDPPGQILEVRAEPMDLFSAPQEFTQRAGEQAAPEFTLNAAAQLFRAVQFVQFAKRPELQMFRNQILGGAGLRPERYLRRYIPPEVYQGSPDEFLPLTAFLWFLNSQKSLQMAEDLLRIGQRPPMDALMLLADVLSNGGPTTLMFITDETGHVSSRETSLQRQGMENGPPIVVGVGLAPPELPPWESMEPEPLPGGPPPYEGPPQEPMPPPDPIHEWSTP